MNEKNNYLLKKMLQQANKKLIFTINIYSVLFFKNK